MTDRYIHFVTDIDHNEHVYQNCEVLELAL